MPVDHTPEAVRLDQDSAPPRTSQTVATRGLGRVCGAAAEPGRSVHAQDRRGRAGSTGLWAVDTRRRPILATVCDKPPRSERPRHPRRPAGGGDLWHGPGRAARPCLRAGAGRTIGPMDTLLDRVLGFT